MFPKHEVRPVAEALQKSGQYCSQHYRVCFMAVGDKGDDDLDARYPEMPQILWSAVLGFIHERFRAFRRQKRSHPQWDGPGQELWALADRTRDSAKFVAGVRIEDKKA